VTPIVVPGSIDAAGAARLLADIRAAAEATRHEAIVFTGADGTFCNGLDLGGLAGAGRDEIAAAVDTFVQCLALLQQVSKPTMALVDGDARGGGLGLAAACDVVVATDRSRFALPELLWGLLPAVIYAPLRQRMTLQQCRLWMLIGGSRTAAEARGSGLVDEVVAHDQLARASARWQRMLSRPRPEAIARMRAFVADDVTRGPDALARGAAITTESLLDEGVRQSLRLFHETDELPWNVT
jgi:enoyl-CoA hydratase/carnithine racemase